MKKLFTALSLGMLIALAGCGKGTSGGPGATTPETKKPTLGQNEDTFSLAISSGKLNQGQTMAFPITIKRGKNFTEDVALKLSELPTGVTLFSANPMIKHSETEAKFDLKAAPDAALGDFTVKLTGHPSKGSDSATEMKLSIAKADPKDAANATDDAAKVAKSKWDEYTAAMQTQLKEASAKFEVLKDSAAKATGQAKTDLDAKVAAAKVKLDSASAKLDELKAASADRWEKVKEGAGNAFDDLKKGFD